MTWKAVVKRVAVVAVAGVAIYLVAPKLASVLGAWPRLSTLNPVWFTVALAAELASFTCNFALQRVALQTSGWFAVVTAGLTGNAVTDSLPGSEATGAAVQFGMLTTAGFDPGTAVGGLTAFSLLGVGGLLGLPVFALPALLAGLPASPGLVHTALLGLAAFACFAVFGVVILRAAGHPRLPDRLLLAAAARGTAGLPAVPPPLPAPRAARRRPRPGAVAVHAQPASVHGWPCPPGRGQL